MDYAHGNVRVNVEGDRLSSLPDDLIHKILSFLSITEAIETSVLSSRWRFIWTSMPYLDFSSEDFTTLPAFSKFVTHVLSGRDNQTELHSVKLAFRGKVSQVFVKRILDYAFSHNVQQLNVTFLDRKKKEFPRSLFNSQSLKHLTLTGYHSNHSIMNPHTWELPSLASLNLHYFTLIDDDTDKHVGLLSKCANLQNLTLTMCRLMGLNGFNISHPGLSSLTLDDPDDDSEGINMVTPQLKTLAILYCHSELKISAPNLASFHFKDNFGPCGLSADFLHLEKADICIASYSKNKEKAHKIVCFLQQFHSVKFLALSFEIIMALCLSVEQISHQPSPFTNLRSLKIYPVDIAHKAEEQTLPEVTLFTEVKNYLLDSSPGATFTMVSHDEIRAKRNVKSAQRLMRDLQVLLDRWKNNSETKRTDMKQGDAPIESDMATVHEQVAVENHKEQLDTEMKWNFEGRMAHIKGYWVDLNEQLEKGYKKTGRIISMLEELEVVLTMLPTSHRDKLEERFFNLCAEAKSIMGNVMDRMQI